MGLNSWVCPSEGIPALAQEKTTLSVRSVKAGGILLPGGLHLALRTLISEEYAWFDSKFAALGLSTLRVAPR